MTKDDFHDKLIIDFVSTKGRAPDKHELINMLTTENRLNYLYDMLDQLNARVSKLEK